MVLACLAAYRVIENAPADQVRAIADRALGKGELFDDISGAQIAHMAITALIFADQLKLAASWLDRALSDAQAQGSVINYATASACRADLNYRLGDLAQAEADGRAAVEAVGSTWVIMTLWALNPLMNTLIDRDDIGEAGRFAEGEASELIARDRMTHRYALEARGRLRVAQGRGEEGLADLLLVGRSCATWGVCNPGVFAWRSSAALAHLQLGHDDEARQLAHEEVALAPFANRARWGSRCAPPGWQKAGGPASSCCEKPSRCSRARRRGSSTRAQ
jgi:hypothetical protein